MVVVPGMSKNTKVIDIGIVVKNEVNNAGSTFLTIMINFVEGRGSIISLGILDFQVESIDEVADQLTIRVGDVGQISHIAGDHAEPRVDVTAYNDFPYLRKFQTL